MRKKKGEPFLKKLWHFIWHDDSIWSWLVNVVLAFVIVKFIVFPFLGLVLATSHPVVAVVSGSMEHDDSFDAWWGDYGDWYGQVNVTREDFMDFRFSNGFNKGDIMFLRGKKMSDIEVGDVLIFQGGRPDPIIHRVVRSWDVNGEYYFQTKGDHNANSISGGFAQEVEIHQDRVIGVAVLRVPWLGWVKIGFVELMKGVKG